MKKTLLLGISAAAVACLMVPAAHAQVTGNLESSLAETGDQTADGGAFHRYYQVDGVGNGTVNPNADNACATQPIEADRSCLGGYKAMQNNIRGYTDALENFGVTSYGNLFNAVWDVETGSGTAAHRGFYAWGSNRPQAGDTYDWRDDASCVNAPAFAGSCLGNLNPGTTNTAIANVPGGTINANGALSPIPVPRVSNFDSGTGVISLEWDAATPNSGEAQVAGYELNVATSGAGGGSCAAPLASAYTPVKPVAGENTTVAPAEYGASPGDELCVTFALRIEYPPTTTGGPVTSRFLSANGQSTYIGSGALASTVFGVQASTVGNRLVRGEQPVQISFSTAIEQPGDVFTVVTGPTAEGPFAPVEGCSFEAQFGETGGIYDTCVTTVSRGECPYFSVQSDSAGLIQPATQLEGCKDRPGQGRGRGR